MIKHFTHGEIQTILEKDTFSSIESYQQIRRRKTNLCQFDKSKRLLEFLFELLSVYNTNAESSTGSDVNIK